MRIILIDFVKPKKAELDLIVKSLHDENVIAYPTDTVYGLGCLVNNKKGINKIRKIKGREAAKPMLVLISSLAMLKKYFKVNSQQLTYLKKIWPGPVSVILAQKGFFPVELSAGLETVAVRLPKNDFLVKMIRKVGMPIVSTSLNLSGQKVLKNVDNLGDYFKTTKPDLAIDIGRDLNSQPSQLIDLCDPVDIKIIRK